MKARSVFAGALRLEMQQLARDKAYVALTLLAAVSFLALVSLFGLTASDAPMALIAHDRGPYARRFVEALVKVPHAFRLERMSPEEAEAKLKEGLIVGAIVIPEDFGARIAQGDTVVVDVEVDNVNVDVVADIQRSVPGAIVEFGRDVGLPGLRVKMVEHDVWPRDTSFLPYITVSGLGLVSFIIASVLGAIAVARELEGRTLRLWRTSPASIGAVLAGKLAAAALVGVCAVALTAALVMIGYGAVPTRPFAAALGLLVSVLAFTAVGACIGALARRTLVLVPLLFGLAMPLYIDSGALEPTRFDGETIWQISHLTPLYYVVGWLQWAFFGLRITPEPPWLNLLVIVAIGAAALAIARWRLSRPSALARTAT